MLQRKPGLLKNLVLLILAVLLVFVPIWIVLVNSMKPQSEAAALSLGLPTQFEFWSNYSDVIERSNYLISFGNSLLVTSLSVVALLAVGVPAAWAFARSGSRVLRVTYWVSLVGVLLPLPVVPVVFLLQSFGLQGTQAGLVIFTIGSRVSLVIFLLTGFVRSLPREIEEASTMDGAGKFRTLFWVVVPMMKPVLLATIVVLSVLIWNDFMGPLFLLGGPDQATLPLGLYRLSSGIAQATAWNYVFTHVILVSLPLLILYLVAQRRIVDGITAGALRG